MNQVTTIERDKSPVAALQAQLEQGAREFKKALPAHISPDKLQRTILTAVQNNPKLLHADRKSLLNSAMKAAQDGLLPDGREAAFVEFKVSEKIDGQWHSRQTVQYMPMVYGLRKKIVQSGEITSLEVNVVYRAEVEKGAFLYEVGLEPPLRHRPALDLTEAETGDDEIIAAYSIATFKDGSKSFELMRRFEIDKVREASQTGSTRDKFGKPRQAKGPWVDWFAEMAKKTVMRRHSKSLPMSGDILDVEARDDGIYGESTSGVLGLADGGQPVLIEDRQDDEQHDPETGEIIDAPAATSSAPEPQLPEGMEPEPQQAGDAADAPHPAQARADEIIADYRAIISIMDLNSVASRAKDDIAAMPIEIAATVTAEFEASKARIAAAHDAAKRAERVGTQ